MCSQHVLRLVGVCQRRVVSHLVTIVQIHRNNINVIQTKASGFYLKRGFVSPSMVINSHLEPFWGFPGLETCYQCGGEAVVTPIWDPADPSVTSLTFDWSLLSVRLCFLCLSSPSKAAKFLISHAEREAGLNPDQAGRCKRELIPAAGPNLGEFRDNSFVALFLRRVGGGAPFWGEVGGLWRQHFSLESSHCPKEKETNKSWCLEAKLTKLPVTVVL